MNQQSHESLRLHCSKTLELSDLCHLTRFADVRTGVGLLWIKTSSQGSPKIDKSFGDIWDIIEILNSPYFKAPTFWTLHPDLSVHGRPSGFGSTKKQLASQIREAQRETDQLGCVSNVKWLRMAVKTVFSQDFSPLWLLRGCFKPWGPVLKETAKSEMPIILIQPCPMTNILDMIWLGK